LLRVAPVVLAIAVAPSAEATFPGPNGRIVFEQNSDIYLANPDGSVHTRLTTTDEFAEYRPAFSADEGKIAFVSGRSGNNDIWLMNTDGSNQQQLTEDPGGDSDPAFSPDGTKIVFTSDRDIVGSHVWIMDADGSNETQLTTTDGHRDSPSFSPDGTKILYGAFNEIRTMNPDGTGDAPLVTGMGRVADPSWSPGGNLVVFHGFGDDLLGEIYSVPASGGGVLRLTDHPGIAQHPVVSPDGQRILFFGQNAANESALFTMAIDGADVTELTTVEGSADSAPDWGSLALATPAPRPGVSANVVVRAGSVLVKQPSSNRFVEVTRETQIPIGSLVDTTNGTVELTTARGSGGLTQAGTFRGGVFKVGQKKGGSPLTTLTLRGPSLRCGGRGGNLARAAGRRRSRRLLGNTRGGRFRTRGRNSTASVRGTVWLTKDSCKGTLTVVRKGVVVVRDLRKRRTKTLRKGQRYLARAPKRR
jgi:hypothetical protein